MTTLPAHSKSTVVASLNELRAQLLQLQPAGPKGFEGLVATALADLTGLTFRLAKSGSQFGRDASTSRARFAIAMEAKRYTEPLRLETVAGKIWIASGELASDIDLWVLGATSEMGDGVLAKLEKMLEEQGISLLVLDWPTAPLPRLAVLLAAASARVMQWCLANTPCASASKIRAALELIESDDAFASARNQLVNEISAGYVGLSALAESNRKWCDRVFSERTASQQAFGQYLTVSDPKRPAIPRPSVEAALDAALSKVPQTPTCIAILGPEGSGKSWLSARWWTTAADTPILLIGGAQVANLIDPKRPMETLANLIATQEGEVNSDAKSKRWLRRIHRWQDRPLTQASEGFQFLVVLDGLNERGGMPWAETIFRLACVVNKLGGHLLVTCRERFWDREIAPRLAGVSVMPVKIGDYTSDELDELLRQRGIRIDSIPERVRAFIRNPRICSVALDLLDRLSAQADELTIERLLLEYWRRRLEERGDLIAHNICDFDKLLRSHAKALREDRSVQFDRDDWRVHSGAARRGDGRSIENDLTDIEEGAFLRVANNRDGYYEFKPESVPFALGLLVARELQDELRKEIRDPTDVIDSIVEEVQGFDLVGEALRAAAGIACFEMEYPANGRAALISSWLDLQNVPDSDFETLTAYVAACPTAALDATEAAFSVPSSARRRKWLLAALLDKRDRPRVESALSPRIGKWMSLWSRTPRRLGFNSEGGDASQQAHASRIADKLSRLTPNEEAFRAKACIEVDSPEAMQLDSAAALLMAGRPLAVYAENILAWAFSWSLTGNFGRADSALAWVVRLNREDFPAFELRLRASIDQLLNAPNSDVGRAAAAIALRILGTVAASEYADQLNPRQRLEGWRRVESYCATDPFDPASSRPSNLINAIREANSVDPLQVWCSMSCGEKDIELGWITPGLVRFEPSAIISLLLSIARTAEVRSQLPLRQLSWHLAKLSPLFDAETLAAVFSGYKRLVQNPDLVATADQCHVAGSVLLSLLPHYPAQEQLGLFLELPHEVGDWYAFRELFAPLDPYDLEATLSATESDPRRFRRALFFASAHRTTLTDQSRRTLGRALEHNDPLVVTCASDVAYAARDAALDEMVIAAARRRAGNDGADTNAFWRDRAVAAAVIALKRDGDIFLIAPRFSGLAAGCLGGALDDRIAAETDRAIERLLGSIQASEPRLGRLVLEVDRSGQESLQRIEDRAEEDGEGPDQDIDEYAERQKALREETDAYLKQLEAEGVQALAHEPDVAALKRLASRNANQAAAWASRILAESNPARLATVRNLALGLAEALAETSPKTTAALITHVADACSPVAIVFGDARIPQDIAALFSGPDVEALSALREQAFGRATTDADLETLIFAAEAAGHMKWLEEWIHKEASTGMPGRIARAITIEGFLTTTTGSPTLLARDWGAGFLGQVAESARFAYDRNTWAKTWADMAVNASNTEDFWRWGELTAGIADIRAFHWFDPDFDMPLMQRFGRKLFKLIRQTAEKRTSKRKETLFGLKKPDRSLLHQLAPQSIRV